MKTYKIRKKSPIIVYPGSCIQQNHGEGVDGHGYVIWNLKTKAYRHLDIGNECGFFTIDINKGVLVTDISNLPSKVRLRVRCLESVATEVKEVVASIRKISEIIEITYVRVDAEHVSTPSSIGIKDLNLTDLDTVEYQNELISQFLKKKIVDGTMTDEMLASIFKINEIYNQQVDREKVVRNIRWKPKMFEFSNMFSYGEDNTIDFSKMKDVVGIFAQNASGKSSILSALSFCIFDKCDRAFKATHILNSQKMSFRCKFNFEINGVDFYIERIGKSDKKGNVKVDVKFWKEVDGKVTELNGEARRSTNDMIRSYLGTYDDFVLTVLSVQNNRSGNFVDMGQTERKDLLSQFMGLNIFDELYQPALEKLKEMEAEIKTYVKYDTTDDVDEISRKLKVANEQSELETVECSALVIERDRLNAQIISITEGIVKFTEEISTDIVALRSAESKLVNSLENHEILKKKLESELSDMKSEQDDLKDGLKKFIESGIEKQFSDVTALDAARLSKKHEIDKKKIFVTSKLEKLSKLEEHEYDPECKFCVNNEFVKDALDAKSTIGKDKIDAEALLKEYAVIEKGLVDAPKIKLEYSIYKSLPGKISELDKRIFNSNREQLVLQNKVTVDTNSLKDTRVMIDRYHKQEESIKNNLKIEEDRKELVTQLNSTVRKISDKTSSINEINVKKGKLAYEKEIKESLVAKVKSLESGVVAYRHYVMAVSRDGIPFDLISQAVPIIEKEVNTILSQITEFGINILVDGKNVLTNIVYSDRSWPLEMSSGLERFLTSLVLRSALINISNLPRPNFMAIDEGFGCADSDNLASMNALFSILKTQFDFMFIISHLDSMKDMVDNTIEIKKENGFSKITM
jgi:DNA repair exonuclease SbcCD ATPase subunit